MKEMLECESLENLSFLDVGSGSGLSSLAARRLGAQVYSFDFDPASVKATQRIKDRFSPGDKEWTIDEGSVLDVNFMTALPQADIVYSWGVLHHTGQMYHAFDLVRAKVKPGGRLFIAIYHDTGSSARRWAKMKKLYCSGLLGQWTVMVLFAPKEFVFPFVRDLLSLRNPFKRYRDYYHKRGMSRFHDWLDWLGGYPYEFAKPEQVFRYFRKYGYNLLNMSLTKHNACNQFVFHLNQSELHDCFAQCEKSQELS